MNLGDYDMSSDDDSSSSHLHTIAPSALQYGEDYAEEEIMVDEEESGYAALEFPDTIYFVKETSLVLGRDTKLQSWLNDHVDSRRDERLRRRSLRRNGSSTSIKSPPPPRRVSPGLDAELGTVEGGIGRAPYQAIQELQNGDAFLPIHTPMDQESGDVPDLGAISKQHLRLRLDEDAGWSMQVLGRNGCIINDDYYHQHDEIELQDGDNIQIAGLSFYFRLPDMAESDDEDMKPAMDAITNGQAANSSDDEALVTKKIPKLVLKHNRLVDQASSETPATGVDDDDDDDGDGDSPPKAVKKSKYPMDPNELLRKGEVLPQKRGPGRPPKNGMMSKREMKERLKMMEDERRRQNGEEATPKSGKNGAKRTENGEAEKKAKKRRRSDADDPKRAKDKPSPGPRTPSPKIEDYTPQQLEKPSSTYAELLYPLLQETGPLSLQEIYRQFEKKWPYYKFGCKGTGWQSSIRHTVNTNVEKGEGHFVKDSKDGKGFKWAANKNNPVPIKPSRASNTSQPPTYHSHPPAPYGGAHNHNYAPRPFNGYGMHAPGPFPQHMRPPGPAPQYPRPPFPFRPEAPQQRPGSSTEQQQPPQQQQQQPQPGAPPLPQNLGPRTPYPQPYHPSPAPPQQQHNSGLPQGQQQPGQARAPAPQPTGSPAQGPVPSVSAPTTLPLNTTSQGPTQVAAAQGQPRQGTSAASQPAQPPRPASTQNVQAAPAPPPPPPIPRPTSGQTAAGQATAPPAPPRRVPDIPMSGLECLLRGIRPPVFDDFKKVFLEEQPSVQAGNREAVERQLAQAIDWFMRNRTIDKEHDNEPEEIRALIKTLKGLLLNQHKGVQRQRQLRQQGMANGAGTPRSSTPVTPATAQSPRPAQGQPRPAAVQSPYSGATRPQQAPVGPDKGAPAVPPAPDANVSTPTPAAAAAAAPAPVDGGAGSTPAPET